MAREGIVDAMKLSLLIRVADEGRFAQCNWIPAGRCGWKNPTGLL